MTKKSMARQKRDLASKEITRLRNTETPGEDDNVFKELDTFFENNTSWDDLSELYNNLAKRLVVNYEELIRLFKTPGLIMFLENEEFKETKILFEGIGRDFDQLSNALKLIHNRHKDYSGAAKNQDEMLLSIEIFEAYSNYTIRYDAIITPTYNTIVERAGKALGKINEAVVQEEKRHEDLNVNVVKDVEYREVTNEEYQEVIKQEESK